MRGIGIAVLVAVLCGSCTTTKPDGDRRHPFEVGFDAGVREAREELRDGHPTIYVFGMAPATSPDPSTGLPRKEIGGCAVDEATLGRAAGHNRTVLEWLGSRGTTTRP